MTGGIGEKKDVPGVYRIQRTCVHDGPGIRTTVFFEGCGLRCLWCQNPEALKGMNGKAEGFDGTFKGLMETLLRDREYYANTGGGVTLSGGDPLLHDPETLVPFLSRLRDEGIHTAVETSLHVPWEHAARIVPLVDLFLVDLKVVGDGGLHRKLTGHGQERILENIEKLLSMNANVTFRMVMVPGLNDSETNIAAAAEFLKGHGRNEVELLAYHSMYLDKAKRLGIEVRDLGITEEHAEASVNTAVNIFNRHGINAAALSKEEPRKKAVFTERVCAIQRAIRESGHNLCFESSNLKTAYYRKNGFKKPNPVHRAERLAYVLKKKEITVYPGELLVGNFTSKRRGGQVWEEHYGILFTTILHQIHRQKPVAFQCSVKDRLKFLTRTFPFWAKHSLLAKVNKTLPDFMRVVSRCSEMSTGFNNNMAAIAHFIVNYERMLQLGTTGIIKEIEKTRGNAPEERKPFYDGAVIALRGLEDFAERYSRKLDDMSRCEKDPARRKELAEMASVCKRVPKHPARTTHEALQSMLFLHVALCIESYENAISPGRLDQILYPYYERDRAEGRIDFDKARELLALFILKMDEVILVNDGDTFLKIGRLFETMSTDQTVTAGGMDRAGNDATNDLTYALLDICELQPYAVNMAARIHPGSPSKYLDRIAEVYINGAPMPALYNDGVYIPTLLGHYRTAVEDARNYAIVGCVEPNASDDHFGNTDCANMNVALPFLQALKGEDADLWNFGLKDQIGKLVAKAVEHNFGGSGKISHFVTRRYDLVRRKLKTPSIKKTAPPATMNELLARFRIRLNRLARSILADHQEIERVIGAHFTTPLASSLSTGCIASGKDLNQGGSAINSSGIQAVGITDVADSLHALDEVVFKTRRFTLKRVIDAMDHNFERPRDKAVRDVLLAVPKFGEDGSKKAAEWVNRTLRIYTGALAQVPGCPRNGIYTAGYYALNVNDIYGAKTPALPSGRLKGVSLANGVAPHYGMESGDLLSALNSVSDVDFTSYAPNGTTVTFTIDSALFQGNGGVRNLSAIFSTFFKKGGMQFQPNVINRKILRDAYDNPGKYPYLLVRVAGYCAYFNDLSDELKRIIMNRTCYGEA
jgi:formate C-acetyltransferase